METRAAWKKKLNRNPDTGSEGFLLNFKEIEKLYKFGYVRANNTFIIEVTKTGIGTSYVVSTIVNNRIVEENITDYESW